MTHWTDVPRELGACDAALEVGADYATFKAFWRNCANPYWLIWAVDHNLVAVPPGFDAAVKPAWGMYAATRERAWNLYATVLDREDVWTDAMAATASDARDEYEATVSASYRHCADCIRAAAEPFTLGPAWAEEAHEAHEAERKQLAQGSGTC